MEIRFTASIRAALEFMLSIAQERDDLNPCIPRLKKPIWLNITWVTKIHATPIRWVKRLEPRQDNDGGWYLSRTVEFFSNNIRIASLDLVCMKFDKENTDDESTWMVKKIGYYYRDPKRYYYLPTEEWLKNWEEVDIYTGVRFARLMEAR